MMRLERNTLLACVLAATTALCCPQKAWAGNDFDFSAEWWWQEVDKITNYVEQYRHIAIAEMDRTGVPASIKMAQGILESGSGESELATVAKNHFGIKCGGDWSGSTHFVWDDEPVKSCFRVYGTVEESYIAHSEFLLNPAKAFRYGHLFLLPRTDYKAWAEGLQTSGYATSKTYAVKLISLIERYELYKLDHLTLRKQEPTLAEAERIFKEPKPRYMDTLLIGKTEEDTLVGGISEPNNVQWSDNNKPAVASIWADMVTEQQRIEWGKQPFLMNQRRVVLSQKGETLSALAQRLGLKKNALIKYNELKKRPLKEGQYLFLEPKARSFEGASRHICREGQSMYDVAQYYGLRLRSLQKMNPKYKPDAPLSLGTQLRLR